METTSPKRSLATAAYMEITEAELFRFETIRDAYRQEAKRQNKEAKNWRERLRYAAADKSVKKEVVGPDSAKGKAS